MSSQKSTDLYREKNAVVGGVLYLVATPIGNLSDLSERAVKVLSEVDFIAAEDTRNSLGLLTHLGIKKPLVSYFEHNKAERGGYIASRLQNGESCALITDAGTPAISDPGEDIVRICSENGIKVISIPGACAAITALTLSALPTGRFCFEGFLSTDKSERRERLEELKREKRTMIIYEAPHKLIRTLDDLANAFGADRRISLCRELTKLNEDVMRTTVGGAREYYESVSPRGEYVLVIEGMKDVPAVVPDLSIKDEVTSKMNEGMSKMEAVKFVAKRRKLPKNDVYQEMLDKDDT